jgi:hypothetical protein
MAFSQSRRCLVILENGTQLSDPMPHILTALYGQQKLSLPQSIKYPFWFDVISPELSLNHVISRFDISVNSRGADELKQFNIPRTFPAVIMHDDSDYRFYYFSGDFCDNPIGMGSSFFKGVGAFKWLFYNGEDDSERKGFFWNFYRPMMAHILENTHPKK